MKTEQLYMFAEKNNITIIPFALEKTKSSSVNYNNNYYIGLDETAIETQADERVHLAHELGHCMTHSFYYAYSPLDIREKHEYRANKWAIKKIIPKAEFIGLLKSGMGVWEIAEYYNVTEDFIKKAYHLYCEMEIA